jgi:flagellar motor protein MotB
MTSKLLLATTLGLFSTLVLTGQNQPEHLATVPIYRVTVVDRTISAVDYQYRNGPTNIDFRGTVLLPQSKGGAIVESKTGRAAIDARFDRLEAPTRFGREYLTYVLWAITPDGHAKNLGEILPGSSDKAHLQVTTELQAFGMIVTAEPYAAVRQPSDVVVLENQPRPDTIGGTEPIQAKYELLPRGHYTYNVQEGMEGMAAAEANAVRLSPDRYQSLVELYEAQNAVQIAQSADAAQYAPDTFGKAQNQLLQAQEAMDHKAGMTTVVTLARQAAQTAEDARILAIQRKQGEELAQARDQAARAEAQKAQAEAAAQTAQTQAAAARALLEQERAAKQQAQADAAAANALAAANAAALQQAPQAVVQAQSAPYRDDSRKQELRRQLLEQFSVTVSARDTPRGLTLTLPDSDFEGARVSPAVYERLARVAALLRAHPDLTVEVDGHETFSFERAHAVRDVLIDHGLPAGAVMARALGDSRPLTSNATAAGRLQNRRVEIVISGNPIGDMPYWAQSYTLKP